MGEMQGYDPSRMRISDADRNKVADVLRTAAGEGRLDLDELDERLEQTFAAKTYAELVPLTADLYAPAPGVAAPGVPVARPAAGVATGPGHANSSAILGDCKRRGVWHLPDHHTAFALMGTVLLDLRQVTLSARETTIVANSIMGDVKILVPAHFNVVVDGTPIMGEFGHGKDKVAAQLGPDSPTIRVKGLSLMGSVSVTRLPPPGTPKKILGTY